MKDYYKVLGVSRKANLSQIKSAYRSLARQYHPDYNRNSDVAEAMMKMLNDAYEILSDHRKRNAYDEVLGEERMDIATKQDEDVYELISRKISEKYGSQRPPLLKVFWWWLYDLGLNRILSGVIGLVYIVLAARLGPKTLTETIMSVLPVLACIWYGDEIGSFTGYFVRGGYIDTPTPGFLVRAGGWVLLLLPVFAYGYSIYHSSH